MVRAGIRANSLQTAIKDDLAAATTVSPRLAAVIRPRCGAFAGPSHDRNRAPIPDRDGNTPLLRHRENGDGN